MKNYFDKEIVMTREDNKNFKKSTKFWICDNDIKVRDHCHITVKI